VNDITDRRGLKQEWANMDDDIREEIFTTWIERVKNQRVSSIAKPTHTDNRLVLLYDALYAVDQWLNSDDVWVTDKDGNRIEGGRVETKSGSLTLKLLSYMQP